MSVQDDVKALPRQTLRHCREDDELGIVRPVADSYLTAVVTIARHQQHWLLKAYRYEAQFVALLPQTEEAAAAKDIAASLKALMDLEADKILNLAAGTIASTATSSIANSAPAAASPSAAS